MAAAECLLPRALDARLPRERTRNARVLHDWDRYVRDTGQPRPGELRVLLLSNSQGRGPECPADAIYPALLEQRLNEGRTGPRVRVVNWSFAASQLPEAVVLLARAQELRPQVVLAVFPPNLLTAVPDGAEPARLESDVTDTAWLYRARLPPEFARRYLHASSAVRALLARGWPLFRFRELPAYVLALRHPWLRPFFPGAIASPWMDEPSGARARRETAPAPRFPRQDADPGRLDLLTEAARPLDTRRVFVVEPLWYRVPELHEPMVAAVESGLAARGWEVWDLKDAVVWAQFFEDSVHLTPEGHRVLADALAARVAPLLPPKGAPAP